MTNTDTAAEHGTRAARVRPFKFRGRYFTAISLRLTGAPVDRDFLDSLDRHLRQTPQFFESAPMVIDLEEAGAGFGNADLPRLVRELKDRRLMPFGVLNATAVMAQAAADAGLINVDTGQDGPLRDAPAAEAKDTAIIGADELPSQSERAERAKQRRAARAKAEVVETPPAPQNKVITTPVRSGQVIVADGGDLTVIGSVSSGAELIAAGNIHVYGRLRGRAMAGALGDESARIFVQALDAELVAIAGHYRTPENFGDDVRGKFVQVALKDDTLQMSLLD